VCPIYGMRRKPYLTIGALLYSGAFVLYALAAVDNVVRKYYLSCHVMSCYIIFHDIFIFDAGSYFLLKWLQLVYAEEYM
jgi:hypothetical protein